MLRTAALCVICSSAMLADDLPRGVVNSQRPHDVSLTPQESLERITVPAGFRVTLFAGEPDVRRPIAFDFDDRGRLWVVENYSHPEWKADGSTDRILILEDTDHDGQFDRRTVFWDKGRYLTGIALGHGGVWIANTPELSFIPNRDHDDVPDSEPVVVLDGFQVSANNVLNNFHWGPDGWLYGAIGLSEPSCVGMPGSSDEDRISISRGMWRYHPIREKFEVVADGMVNPWGADFNQFGDLFTTNTVIAHLWHIVPGMYCQRRDGEGNHPYVYRRIQSIANHLHWGGGQWHDSRMKHDRHSVAGGGHAHCGGMVYLGDNWPQPFHGKFFTANLHGNRVNCDQLVPSRSTYVGVHDEDFLLANDPWFRGLSLKYGPDGGVYISDWHDLGECHDNDGSHRSSGRIYKVVYQQPTQPTTNLGTLSNIELADLHLHPNEWWVRHARRLLHERATADDDIGAARKRLRQIFANGNELVQLKAIWTLFVINDVTETECIELLQHESEHLRRWAVRFLVDAGSPGQEALAALVQLATVEESPTVRLALASSLQRVLPDHRWPIAEPLMAHAEDALDPYIPLMIWYGVEPVVAADETQSLQSAMFTKTPLLRRFIARRIAEMESSSSESLIVLAALRAQNDKTRLDLLQGMLEALDTRGGQIMPLSWQGLYTQIAASRDARLRSVAVRLASIFGDTTAISQLRQIVVDRTSLPRERSDALRALLKIDEGVPLAVLHELMEEPSQLRKDVMAALMVRNDLSTADVLLRAYGSLGSAERADAIAVLATRRDFAVQLLDAIEQSTVLREDVSAFTLQQLRTFPDSLIQKRIAELWSGDSERMQKSDEIASYKQKMNAEYLAQGHARAGRQVFENSCATCHTLFGEGGNVGPDLTGSGRKQLDYFLQNLIDPSATIDPAYRLTNLFTSDGRLFSGLIVYQGDQYLVMRTQEAEIRLALDDIEEMRISPRSMMPEGMLRGFTDEQVRDLILYLASDRQIPKVASAAKE